MEQEAMEAAKLKSSPKVARLRTTKKEVDYLAGESDKQFNVALREFQGDPEAAAKILEFVSLTLFVAPADDRAAPHPIQDLGSGSDLVETTTSSTSTRSKLNNETDPLSGLDAPTPVPNVDRLVRRLKMRLSITTTPRRSV